jgi:hypothetical protein
MGRRLKRLGLAAITAILAVNVWTGGPLAALWVGSRVQGDGPPSMGAVLVTVLVLAAICFVLYRALGAVSRAYETEVGAAPTVRTHAPWLRSMRGEREHYPGVTTHLTTPELIVVVTVIVAVLAFEVWFFFLSGSPIGGGGASSGR